MTTVSAGLYTYELDDDPVTPPPTQTFYTRRSRLDTSRASIEVTDENGGFIGRLRGDLGPVSWRVDGYGRTTLVMPPAEAARRQELIEFGNRVVIRFENDLPPWVGVIDPPREQAADRTTINMYSLEYALGWELSDRYDAYVSDLDRNTPDYILSRLVQGNNLGLTAYRVASNEPSIDVTFSYVDLLTAAGQLRAQNERFHWFIAPAGVQAWSPGLWMYYSYRRDRRENVRLVEGHNLLNVEIVETGPLYNDVTAAAGNDDPASTDDTPLVYRFARPNRYGPREMFVPFPDVTIDLDDSSDPVAVQLQRKLLGNAYAEYERYANPRTRYRGVVLNRPPSPFGSYGLGDLITLKLNGYGRRGVEVSVTVIGMEFDPQAGYVTLVFDEGETTI